MSHRYLAVDHGDKRIGLAISDSTGTIATPLQVIYHISRMVDAASVAQVASDRQVDTIILGFPQDINAEPGAQARKILRFAEELRKQTHIPILLWDESFSTQEAYHVQTVLKINRNKRNDSIDMLAATVILQNFLEHLRKQEEGLDE